MSDDVREVSASPIAVPPHSGSNGFVSDYFGAASGYWQTAEGRLCSASGRFTLAGYTPYEHVFLINKQPDDPRPTDDEFCRVGQVYNGQRIWGGTAYLEENGQWEWIGPVDELDGEVPAWIGQNNRLWAAAEMMSDDYELELIARSTTYDAVVEECPSGEMLTKITTEAATARAVTASITATTRRPLAIPVQPTSLCDGWLEYRYLNAGSPPLGHLLMLGSKPLQARVLAVAAFDVSWAFGLGQGRLVSRPMGLLAEDRGDWWYGEVPPAALVLTQGVLASREVVVSQSRETPDVFSFDARRFVFAKLNIPAATVSCHGAYSLWVKRIA